MGNLLPTRHLVERANALKMERLSMVQTAVLKSAEEGGFIAVNPETETTTQGESVEEALANLREATALYLEEFPRVT